MLVFSMRRLWGGLLCRVIGLWGYVVLIFLDMESFCVDWFSSIIVATDTRMSLRLRRSSITIVGLGFRSRLCGRISIIWVRGACLLSTRSASRCRRCASWWITSMPVISIMSLWLIRLSATLASNRSIRLGFSNKTRQWRFHPRRRSGYLPLPRQRTINPLRR